MCSRHLRERIDWTPTRGRSCRSRQIEETERIHIQRALSRAGGSVSKTADLLGISRKTLWEKMKRLSISGNIKEPSGANVS